MARAHLPLKKTAADRLLTAVWRRSSSMIMLSVSSIFFYSCGDIIPEEELRYEYRIRLGGGTYYGHKQFAALVADFNSAIGYEIIQYAPDDSSANSPLTLVNALERATGKLGFGGVVVVTKQKGLKTTRIESMKIQLDRDYVMTRVPSQPGQKSYAELRLLFFHEVGHGLGLSHAAVTSDVMYPDLVGDKDFAQFSLQVRNIVESRNR